MATEIVEYSIPSSVGTLTASACPQVRTSMTANSAAARGVRKAAGHEADPCQSSDGHSRQAVVSASRFPDAAPTGWSGKLLHGAGADDPVDRRDPTTVPGTATEERMNHRPPVGRGVHEADGRLRRNGHSRSDDSDARVLNALRTVNWPLRSMWR